MPVPGQTLPAVERLIDAALLRDYAAVSGDPNRIHLDAAYAATTPFGGIVAHGMLVLAFLNDALARHFGQPWHESGDLNVRFKAPVRLGERVTAGGSIRSVTAEPDGSLLVRCDVWCATGGPDPVIAGDAAVRLPG